MSDQKVFEQDPDNSAFYRLEFDDVLVLKVRRSSDVTTGQFFRAPGRDTGFYYEWTEAGRTSDTPPRRWPDVAGETVRDGSAVFTARHPSDSTLSAVQSAVWIAEGLTIVSQETAGFAAEVELSGVVDGEEYEITCRMTPTVGKPQDKTFKIVGKHQ